MHHIPIKSYCGEGDGRESVDSYKDSGIVVNKY